MKDITETADLEEELLGTIPELKKRKGSDGKEFYTYLTEGREVGLKELDDKKLTKLSEDVNKKVNAIQMNRLSEQLEIIRQAQRATSAAQQPPRPPPQPPPRPATAPPRR